MPQSRTTFDASGVLIRSEQWNDTTYTAKDGAGVVIEQRALTSEETLALQAQDAETNTDTLTAQVRASIDTLIASRETLRAIRDKANASIGPADTKNIARELMTLAKAVIALERLVGGAVDSTNTGPA